VWATTRPNGSTTADGPDCRLSYETAWEPLAGTIRIGPRFVVTLTGTLDASGGSGVSSAPIFPSAYFLGGTWTATR
jgi:hypothetical protein